MCKSCDNPSEELKRLPELLRTNGINASEMLSPDPSWGGSYILGGFGPVETDHEITVFTGLTFRVVARDSDLQVELNWPGQLSTYCDCNCAEQVVAWLSKMREMISKV